MLDQASFPSVITRFVKISFCFSTSYQHHDVSRMYQYPLLNLLLSIPSVLPVNMVRATPQDHQKNVAAHLRPRIVPPLEKGYDEIAVLMVGFDESDIPFYDEDRLDLLNELDEGYHYTTWSKSFANSTTEALRAEWESTIDDCTTQHGQIPSNLIVLYATGHGHVNSYGNLYLTPGGEHRFTMTINLTRMMTRLRSQIVCPMLVIPDCCHAGSIAASLSEIPARPLHILASSDGLQEEEPASFVDTLVWALKDLRDGTNHCEPSPDNLVRICHAKSKVNVHPKYVKAGVGPRSGAPMLYPCNR